MSIAHPDSLPAHQWLEVLHHAAEELAVVALGWNLDMQARGDSSSLPELWGAEVPLAGDEAGVRVGIASSPEGCQRLGKAFLGLDAGELDLSPEEVADAMCEISNIVVGGVKQRLAPICGEMRIGLPRFFAGMLEVPNDQQLVMSPSKIGDVHACLMIMNLHE